MTRNKLCAKYLGPYKIVFTKGPDRYSVTKIGEHEGVLSTTTATDNIKPWVLIESDVSDSDDASYLSENKTRYQGLILNQDGRVVGSKEPMLTRVRVATQCATNSLYRVKI